MTRILQFHYQSPDDSDDEFWMVTNADGEIEDLIAALEDEYEETTLEDEWNRYEKADYVTACLQKKGYVMRQIAKSKLIKREYEWS